MNESEKYCLEAIRIAVWSGFYDLSEVDELIDDILEKGADEGMLRAAVAPEFAKKAAAEADWPKVTDCDRLDRAFESLESQGVIALQNVGYTQSDGLDEVEETLSERKRGTVQGYCFYHGQDLERALAGDGLMLAFGDLNDDATKMVEIGKLVRKTLEAQGFAVEWNGSSKTRINVPKFDWKRRGQEVV
jgi:hypothetical protein